MKSLINDESADSMIVVIIAASILFFGLTYILFTYSLNAPIEIMNDLISSGMVTADTHRMYSLALNMWSTAPFFMLLGLVLWCYERGKGTDLSPQVFFEYLALMTIGLYTSIYLIYVCGLSLDGITINLDQSILTDVSDKWESSFSTRGTITTLLYYFCLLPCFTTSILYMIHPILRQRETRFGYDSDGYEEPGYEDIELGQV